MENRFRVEVVETAPNELNYAIVFENGRVAINYLRFADLRDLCHQLIAASFQIGTAEDLLRHGV